MEWFPWKHMLTGGAILTVVFLVMKRQKEEGGLGRTSKFLIYVAVAAAAIWVAAVVPALDHYLHGKYKPNGLLRSCIPFLIVWAIANAQNLRRKARGLPESLATFAVKSGFAAGLAGRLLFDLVGLNRYLLVWPHLSRHTDWTWAVLNGVGLVVYLVVYLGKRE